MKFLSAIILLIMLSFVHSAVSSIGDLGSVVKCADSSAIINGILADFENLKVLSKGTKEFHNLNELI